jgi:hypothetical protein
VKCLLETYGAIFPIVPADISSTMNIQVATLDLSIGIWKPMELFFQLPVNGSSQCSKATQISTVDTVDVGNNPSFSLKQNI